MYHDCRLRASPVSRPARSTAAHRCHSRCTRSSPRGWTGWHRRRKRSSTTPRRSSATRSGWRRWRLFSRTPHSMSPPTLGRLERLELLRRVRDGSAPGREAYLFRHELVREVAYSQLPRAVRAAKHLRAAAWLESLPSHRADLLALHRERAADASATGPGDKAGLPTSTCSASSGPAGPHRWPCRPDDRALARPGGGRGRQDGRGVRRRTRSCRGRSRTRRVAGHTGARASSSAPWSEEGPPSAASARTTGALPAWRAAACVGVPARRSPAARRRILLRW